MQISSTTLIRAPLEPPRRAGSPERDLDDVYVSGYPTEPCRVSLAARLKGFVPPVAEGALVGTVLGTALQAAGVSVGHLALGGALLGAAVGTYVAIVDPGW